MRKGVSKKFRVDTSKQNLLTKPYGFCCDVNDPNPLELKHKISSPFFLSSGVTNEGPDIKFRIREDEVATSSTRGGHRAGQRSGIRISSRTGIRAGFRIGSSTGIRGGYQNGRQRGGGNDDPMVCQRCRGPLLCYLEDEIETAREIMINKRKEAYNADMDKNIKIAKEKARKKRQRKEKKKGKKRIKQSNEKEEDMLESKEET